jgi:FkbM family methyltransferase
MRIEKAPPKWYLFAIGLPYGRYRVLNYLRKRNRLDRVASFPFYDRTVAIPLNEFPGPDMSKYQYSRISTFARLCDKHLDRFDFVDCGANLGLFSAQFTVCSDRVKKLTAIEPNRKLFPLLESNLSSIHATQVECLNAAVSDFEGQGRLVEPEDYPGTHAMYMVQDPTGDVQVITLSTVLRHRTQPKVAIKLDIEGAEVPALCGAADAIRSLASVVLFVEIHKSVLERTGMSDLEMLAEIETIRRFTRVNADDGALVDSRHAIFDQVNLVNQCDLIGIATAL